MKIISKKKISVYRKKLHLAILKLREKTFKIIKSDLLFAGSPQEIYRKCGNKNCKCTKGGEFRHGPYKVIQINKIGKQKQIPIRKGREKYYYMAKLYVEHINKLAEIRRILKEIDSILTAVTNLRSIDEIEKEKKEDL